MVMCPVTRAVDLTLPFMIVPHDYVGAATSYVKTPGVGVEILCLNVRWLGGMAMGKAKWANNVTHKSQGIVQEGNDMGPLIPQLEIVPSPDNLLSFVHLLKSSCTVAFSCGDVQAEGTPVACILPFMPMKICGDPITVPFGYSVTNMLNDVIVYPHIVDILAGWADIIATMIVDAIAACLAYDGPPGPRSAGQAVLEEITSAIVGPRTAGEALGEGLKQNIPGNVAALVRLVGRHVDPTYDGPANFKFGYSQGMLGGGAYEVGYGSDESVTHGPSAEGLGGFFSGGSQTSSDGPDGSVTETTTSQRGGFHSETDSRTVGSDGRVTESHTETENRWGGSTTETTTRTEGTDGSVTETHRVTDEQNTPILGTNRSSTSETTETTTAPDGSRTQTTTRQETRGGVVTSSRVLPARSGEQEL